MVRRNEVMTCGPSFQLHTPARMMLVHHTSSGHQQDSDGCIARCLYAASIPFPPCDNLMTVEHRAIQVCMCTRHDGDAVAPPCTTVEHNGRDCAEEGPLVGACCQETHLESRMRWSLPRTRSAASRMVWDRPLGSSTIRLPNPAQCAHHAKSYLELPL